MNAPATMQTEGAILTKPQDWAVHMVAAALKCTSEERTSLAYITADKAKHAILKTLNWFEAHDEYEWPDFAGLNYSFDQAMRLRRVLVADVYTALQKAGNIEVGGPGTPESNAGTHGGRRSGGGARTHNRKRLCKREPEVEADAVSERWESPDEDETFLGRVMVHLVERSKLDMGKYMREKRDPGEVADFLHDSLVEMWEGPRREDGEHVQSLKERADVWDRHRRSIPPISTQR